MSAIDLTARRAVLLHEFHQELVAIADWWARYAPDPEQGGFYGEIDAFNQPVTQATKGVILNARILWFFSEAARELQNNEYRRCADRAYEYLRTYFVDPEFGGVYWEVDAAGCPLTTKKQIYAQAFTIYGLCAYYQLTHHADALDLALSCFALIEKHGIDDAQGGYLEAFSRDWGPLTDWRLSDKDLNFPKSQNTHLHVLEAYTSLLQIHPTADIASALRYNIELFDRYMIDRNTWHLRMFMDMAWRDHSPGFTYGHDIEACWLIARALDGLGDENYKAQLLPDLLKIAETTYQQALDESGQVLDSYDFASGRINRDSVWWVQAEALVGFLFAYSESGSDHYFVAAENVWRFIKRYQRDPEGGEWWWMASLDGQPQRTHYKLGFWKCPYHNGRAMIEATRYLDTMVGKS